MITFTIDGKEIKTEEGRTILEAARENNIYIPTLCYHENLLPIGSCRLCIVEIDGYEKPMASCTTAAVEGISVVTNSEKLFRMRQEYLKFLLINHPLECPICDSAGECRLQDLVFEHKIESVDLSAEREPKKAKPYATALIRYSEDRCVLCLRCVHACREVSGRAVLALEGTGIEAKMALVNANDCISCGECLSVCPVGALTEQSSPLKSRKWQTKRQATACPHCGFGCSLVLDVYEGGTITKVIGDASLSPNKGSLCVMGRFGYDFSNHDGRIKVPSIKEKGNSRECSMGEAVEAVASAFEKLDKEGKGIGFVVSPRATNEEAYMISQIAGRFSKGTTGTAGCYHTGKVLDAFGRMGLSYPYNYDDLKKCDLIVVAGADLLANNHLFADKVREAVKLSGARVAVVDPSPTALTRTADVWLKVTPGEDASLLNGIASQLIADGKHDPDAQILQGFADYASGLGASGKQQAIERGGVDEKSFDRFYRLFGGASAVAVIFGSGISSKNESMEALLNLCLVKGIQKNGFIMPTALQSNGVGTVSVLSDPIAPHEILGDTAVAGLFIYEDDPMHYLGGKFVDEALKKKEFIALCDVFPTFISEYADVTVPAGTFAGKEGSSVAGDGFVRKVSRARQGDSHGFEFLRLLLERLGGGLYRDEAEATPVLFSKEVLEADEQGRGRLSQAQAGARFAKPAGTADGNPARPFTLVFRNVFINHHLSGKAVYSKVAYLNNPAIAGGKLFISSEDAAALGISEGGKVIIESERGSLEQPALIKDGLRQGVLEYRMSGNRKDMLDLAGVSEKHIAVTVKKG